MDKLDGQINNPLETRMTTLNQPLNRSIYRLPGSRMWAAYFILALGIFMMVEFISFPLSSKSGTAGQYPWIVLTGLLFFDLCTYLFLVLIRAKLIISPDGIEYHGVGISLYAPWEDVICVEKVRQGNQSVDSLMTREGAEMNWYIRATLGAWPVLKPVVG